MNIKKLETQSTSIKKLDPQSTSWKIMFMLKAQIEQVKNLQRDTFYYQDDIDGMDSYKFLQDLIDTLRSNIGKL